LYVIGNLFGGGKYNKAGSSAGCDVVEKETLIFQGRRDAKTG
jgi:hypothetical protein